MKDAKVFARTAEETKRGGEVVEIMKRWGEELLIKEYKVQIPFHFIFIIMFIYICIEK